MKKITLLFSMGLFMAISVMAQSTSPIGVWKTIDDETGKAKSHVEVYKGSDGKLHGKIVKLLLKSEDAVCDVCPGDKKGKKLMGMEVIWGMEKDGDEYEDGKILKADNGKTYKGKIWVEDGKLMVRGYIGFVYRTQEWDRVK
ncbi:MAG: hypothetical protein ACJAWV_002486 [Flammeovirgaceae bacterium]|jgi:uncharacterized protein (DUF2147 family)